MCGSRGGVGLLHGHPLCLGFAVCFSCRLLLRLQLLCDLTRLLLRQLPLRRSGSVPCRLWMDAPSPRLAKRDGRRRQGQRQLPRKGPFAASLSAASALPSSSRSCSPSCRSRARPASRVSEAGAASIPGRRRHAKVRLCRLRRPKGMRLEPHKLPAREKAQAEAFPRLEQARRETADPEAARGASAELRLLLQLLAAPLALLHLRAGVPDCAAVPQLGCPHAEGKRGSERAGREAPRKLGVCARLGEPARRALAVKV